MGPPVISPETAAVLQQVYQGLEDALAAQKRWLDDRQASLEVVRAGYEQARAERDRMGRDLDRLGVAREVACVAT